MKKVVQQTKFYGTPKEGTEILAGAELKSIMSKVVDFCVKHEIVASAPKVGYGSKAEAPGVALRFDASYIGMAAQKK